MAESRARGETVAAVAFLVSALSSIALAVVYWQGGQTQAEGLLLGAVLGGIGVGIVVWAKQAMPHDEVSEERHLVASPDEQVAALAETIGTGTESIGRRRLLVGAAASAGAALGVALLFPIRSLGPRPGKGLKRTAYAGGGKRVVTADGRPVTVDDLPVDGILTVWPEGHTHDGDAPTLLIHLRPAEDVTVRRGREDWDLDGIVAYSKLCTHAGCPVGLYQPEEQLLLCPCHQSTFDVADGCRPVFGPATRSLPQLPLSRNAEGEIVATGDFSSPVGPGFWDRGRT